VSKHQSPVLPVSPDLSQQRKRAKDLLKALRNGDPDALRRFRLNHPRLAERAPDAIDRAALKLSDAQLVIAREYGFASWRRLKAHIDQRNGASIELAHPFETDLQYYRDRAAGMRSVHSTGEANAVRLIHQFHPGFAAASEDEIRAAEITQEDAEQIVAREHGFDTWDAFAGRIEALKSNGAIEPFRTAFVAIRDDDRAALARVLTANPQLVNAKGTNGNRLLMFAVSMGRRAIVDDLLAAGADPNRPNNKGSTALHNAAYGAPEVSRPDQLAILERLLEADASVEAQAYGDGGTPLAFALFWGHRELAERLAQVAIVPRNLRIAAALGRIDLMRSFFAADDSLLPEAGQAREFHRPHSGFPPWRPTNDPHEIIDEALGWAARNGRVEAMALLLEHGARIDAEPYNGTALHWAVSREQLDGVAFLLDRGADINRRGAFGGARGVTALHVAAAWEGKPASARMLMERGAEVMILDDQFKATPIGWATHFGKAAIRDEIIELGSQRDIFVAVLSGRLDRVARLIDERPALLTARDPKGLTPIELARGEANEEIVAFLESRATAS
jgi:ankyrin repeat protein